MARSTHQTQRGIRAILKDLGEASPSRVGAALGAAAPKAALLRQLMRRMEKAGQLMQPRYGVYQLSPMEWPIDRFADMEDQITDYLRSVGGKAKTGAIQKNVGEGREKMGVFGDRSSYHVFVHYVLRESERFHRLDYGVWKLAHGLYPGCSTP